MSDVYLPPQNSKMYSQCYTVDLTICLYVDREKGNTSICSITHLKVRGAILFPVDAMSSHDDLISLAELVVMSFQIGIPTRLREHFFFLAS